MIESSGECEPGQIVSRGRMAAAEGAIRIVLRTARTSAQRSEVHSTAGKAPLLELFHRILDFDIEGPAVGLKPE
jgi:hypothetical protein